MVDPFDASAVVPPAVEGGDKAKGRRERRGVGSG